MGAFDEIFGNEKQASKQTLEPWKVSPEVQKERDQGRTQILQQEMTDAQARLKAGDPRAQGDIDALSRDLGREKTKQSNAAPSGDFLDQYFDQRIAPQAKPQRIEISGGQPAKPVAQQPQQATAPSDGFTGARNRAGQPVTETSDIVTGALGGLGRTIGGAIHGAATQLLGTPGDINQLIVNTVGSAFPNAPTLPTTKRLQELSPVAPQSQEGKVAQELGQFIPVPGLKGGSKVANALGEQFAKKAAPVAERVEPTMGAITPEQATKATQVLNAPKTAANQPVMAGVGAAARTNEATLQAAMAQASPELKASLAKVKPEDLNIKALDSHLEADSLPVPIKLTAGQASGDPALISHELNVLGTEKDVVNRLNEQNSALKENAELMKERVAPNINTTDYVHDAEHAIDLIGNHIKQDNEAITNAYQKLEEYGAGKIAVDSQSFANGAKQALSVNDEMEFLPSVISNRLEAYTNGKPMNFNQFENLRTVLARETRKAQAANDGNAVHALTLVRGELEKMPLLGETAEAKVLADNARSLAKQQFDLLDKNRESYNPLYEKVFNGGADTKDFIQSVMLRGKNADFEKAMQLANTDPTVMEHLRSGVLDSIIRKSTTQDGKFKSAAFSKAINDLDVNKRLVPLFGDQAKTLRAIANTGTKINARPAGNYVNESKSGTVGVQMAKQFIAEQAKSTPGISYLISPAAKVLGERKIAKQVEKSLKPGAGTKLSDIGK